MLKILREGIVLLAKEAHEAWKTEQAETAEETETVTEKDPTTDSEKTEPMPVYWESDKKELNNNNQQFIDLYLEDASLGRIPDTTEKPVIESHFKYAKVFQLPLKNIIFDGNVLFNAIS